MLSCSRDQGWHDDSSDDQEGPTMAAHSVCTCCHKDSSDHQATAICSIRASHGMTHDHVYLHDFIADSEELAQNEVQLPACCCRAPSTSAKKQMVRGIQQSSDRRKQDTGSQVAPAALLGVGGYADNGITRTRRPSHVKTPWPGVNGLALRCFRSVGPL